MSALVVALYANHDAADRVRAQLVREGFPTDRVELTSAQEPGQAAVIGPSGNLEGQLEEYFSGLFTREEEVANVHVFVDGVQQGHAALTVHPRGDVETDRAMQIMEAAQPLEICDHDLDDQGMERAATPDNSEPFVKQFVDATREIARDTTRARTKH
jgi:hypothetical protein